MGASIRAIPTVRSAMVDKYGEALIRALEVTSKLIYPMQRVVFWGEVSDGKHPAMGIFPMDSHEAVYWNPHVNRDQAFALQSKFFMEVMYAPESQCLTVTVPDPNSPVHSESPRTSYTKAWGDGHHKSAESALMYAITEAALVFAPPHKSYR